MRSCSDASSGSNNGTVPIRSTAVSMASPKRITCKITRGPPIRANEHRDLAQPANFGQCQGRAVASFDGCDSLPTCGRDGTGRHKALKTPWPLAVRVRAPPPALLLTGLIYINALIRFRKVSLPCRLGNGRRTGSLAMHFAGTNGSADPISHDAAIPVDDPRHMTSAQLRRLGMPWLVYLRSGRINGEVAYAIHAADGNTDRGGGGRRSRPRSGVRKRLDIRPCALMSVIATSVERSGVARIFFDMHPTEFLLRRPTAHRGGDRRGVCAGSDKHRGGVGATRSPDRPPV